jgi:hypothetical protein
VLAAVVLVPMLFNALALLPELTIPLPSNNDDATHYVLIQRASEALGSGENVLDPWVPQLELGFPWFIYYQPLPALAVVLVHRALFKIVDLLTVFNAMRYVLLVGFPLTVFWSLRRMGITSAGAAVAAAAASLLSGDFRYGFDYDSYTWRGFGMFTQLWAMHLSFVVLATFYGLFTKGTGARAATFSFSALVLSHLIYAYMLAITLVILFLLTLSRATLRRRAVQLVPVGLSCVLITSVMWLPFIASRAFLGVTPYLQPYKYDSFGAPSILTWLVTGDLLDHGRLPVVTLLLLLGVIAALYLRTAISRAALVLFAFWLVLYFGRPTLGPIVDLLPFHEGLLIHRFIGAVELFAIVLVGIGAAWAFERAGTQHSFARLAVAGGVALACLSPAFAERASFYSLNTRWMRQTADAINSDADARTILQQLAVQPPGRVFAGLRNSEWSRALDFAIPFNSVRFSDLLVFQRYSVVASPYSSITLNADFMWDFDEMRPDHYDLFNVRYVVAAPSTPVPSFLVPLVRTQRYVLYRAPTTGYATLAAQIDREIAATQTALFPKNRVWLNSARPAARSFIRWDYARATRQGDPGQSGGCASGGIASERARPSQIDVLVTCPQTGTLVFKVTYHPNWRVLVDQRPAETFMVSPSYLGVTLPAGEHFVSAVYEATPAKTPLFLLGLLTAALFGAAPTIRQRWPRPGVPVSQSASGV